MDIAQLEQQAAQNLARGNYSDAVALYQQCIYVTPNLISNYWYLGLALLLTDSGLDAQAVWLSALGQQAPEEMELCLAQLLQVLSAEASRHLQSGNVAVAERIYGQILEFDSKEAQAHYNLGLAVALRGDLDEAVTCWQRAVALQPDFADAYQNLGSVFQKQSLFAEAISCYLKALEIKPDCNITYNLGICFCQEGKLDEAIACFRECIQQQPDYTPAYGDLGYGLLLTGKLDEAIASFRSGIVQQPAFADAYCNWSDGKSIQAIILNARFLKALQAQSESADVFWYLGNALTREHKFDSGIACYQKALQLQPDKAEIYLDLGKNLAQQGDWCQAIDCYQQALQLQPDKLEVYLALGKALAEQGDLSQSIVAYRKVLEINPDFAETYLHLGNALLSSGKLDEARACYQQKLKIEPNSAEVYCNLGIALAQQGKGDEAITCFKKVMQLNQDSAQIVDKVMTTLVKQGNLPTENPYFQQVLPVTTPQGFYESTWDWAVNSNLESSNYIQIYPPTQIYLKPPLTLDKFVHFSFRFEAVVELPASFVALVPDGRYWIDRSESQTAIITSDNQILADVSPDFPVLSPGHPDKHPSKHLIFSTGKLPPVESLDATVVVGSGLLNNVYFHWMFDVLPRLELLRLSGIEINDIDYFLINSRTSFQRETLNRLGIPETKRLETYKYPHVKAKKLVVPSFPGSIAWMPKWACEFLISLFLNQKAPEKSSKLERIYISRANVLNRRIINEDEVISLLNKFGFHSVTLEAMSVGEQAALMADAKVVIAPHGGGLTNIVFCSPGTKVIEIFSPNFVYPCYWLVSNLVGLEYYYLLGEISEGFYLHKFLYQNTRFEDVFVNIDSLLKVMELAEVI